MFSVIFDQCAFTTEYHTKTLEYFICQRVSLLHVVLGNSVLSAKQLRKGASMIFHFEGRVGDMIFEVGYFRSF